MGDPSICLVAFKASSQITGRFPDYKLCFRENCIRILFYCDSTFSVVRDQFAFFYKIKISKIFVRPKALVFGITSL